MAHVIPEIQNCDASFRFSAGALLITVTPSAKQPGFLRRCLKLLFKKCVEQNLDEEEVEFFLQGQGITRIALDFPLPVGPIMTFSVKAFHLSRKSREKELPRKLGQNAGSGPKWW